MSEANDDENIPTFPDVPISEIIQSKFYVFEVEDIQTEDDLKQLILLMYQWPEHEFYLFQEKGNSNKLVTTSPAILKDKIEFNFFKHPKFQRDYIRIEANGDSHLEDQQKHLVDQGPMFLRITLTLAQWKRRELEIQQQILAEKASDNNPFEMKPGFMGFSIDLIKAKDWLMRLLNKK